MLILNNVSTRRVTTRLSDKSAVAVDEHSRVGGCVAAPHFANHIPNWIQSNGPSTGSTRERLALKWINRSWVVSTCNEVSLSQVVSQQMSRRPSGIADPRLSGISGLCF